MAIVFSEDTQKEDNEYKKLRETLEKSMSREEIEEIDRAYEWARAAHGGQLRFSGQPYIIHPIAVAQILAEFGMDKSSIIAALLHDIVEDTSATKQDVISRFGEEIASIVDGLTKLTKLSEDANEKKMLNEQADGETNAKSVVMPVINTKEMQQAENLRKMLLAMSQDIRVIIIKLADRIHNLRTLSYMRPHKRREKAKETLDIYAPIAHRLGIKKMKDELEDLALSYLDPFEYNKIEAYLARQQKERGKYLEGIKTEIYERISQQIPDCNITGRIKSVYSIQRKMISQNKSIDEIYDVYAVRIIVNTQDECYHCLGIIHEMYQPVLGRFKDYISTKKKNDYQSLHTTVISKDGTPFEVQIRTWEMHQTAEYGVAAHWKYKLGMTGKEKPDKRLEWIRQLLEEQKETGNPEDLVRTIKEDFIPEEVFVFTPGGDVIDLPAGSTVIDFAYAIHSEVGHKMTSAKVNKRIVPINYQVQTGDIIEIVTTNQKDKGPSRDWMNIARTTAAKAKIRAWFKREKREENIIEGKLAVEREFRRMGIRLADEDREGFMLQQAAKQKVATVDDFYAAVGYGGIYLPKLLANIKDDYNKMLKAKQLEEITEEEIKTVPVKTKRAKGDGVIVEGIENCLVKLSGCCNPIPGDDIIGFITRGHGVSIHKRDCTNVPANIEFAPEPERWIKASWDGESQDSFKANLVITCMDRRGMLLDISTQLDSMGVDIHSINTQASKDGRVVMTFVISVDNLVHLKKVMNKLLRINGITQVDRSFV